MKARAAESLLDRRHRLLGPSLSLSYRSPLHIVRGRGAHLYDADGIEYLDCVNNVAHVGHAHPRVVEAAARQMAELNTNTRYLHEKVLEYAERLTATLPDPLEVAFFVNSGSEANELGLRLARAASGRRDVLVLDVAYHGNTGGLVEVSPYKFDGPGGSGRPEHVHVAPLPDPYRGIHRGRTPETGAAYAADLGRVLDDAAAAGRPVGTFLVEPIPGTAGHVVPPPGYLPAAFAAARAAGAVIVADEVQTGFGRVGEPWWWAAEALGAVPDVVTMGKPIGNGHPIGAVVTTREIAARFANGMEYFSTFGGNPVSAAVGLAVMDVVEDEALRTNARHVGGRLLEGLDGLRGRHPEIGDVRGMGLFIGVEIVREPRSREPDGARAGALVEAARRRNVLLSTDGRAHNVIKIKPPLVLSETDADQIVDTLDAALAGD
ncbi:MAG TPA: aminotransferase class III-fold pyridoxal phosphate-dependent enzyme [Candidatus Limnocylindrales bacterium]|jgi:4-aminobutyrate aminotransferase-like enzyme